jgi:hypothetical protein
MRKKKTPEQTLIENGIGEIVSKIESLLKPYQSTLEIGIAKANGTIGTITLKAEIKLR